MALRKRSFLVLVAALPLAIGLVAIRSGGGTIVRAWNPSSAPAIERHLWDSAVDSMLNYDSPTSAAGAQDPPPPGNYQPSGAANECPGKLGSNVKVDQGCLNLSAAGFFGRGQAHNETAIAVNPADQNQLIASSNDYKLGDGLDGGISYSKDGGSTWQNSEIPLEFTRGSDFDGTSTNSNQCATASPAPARMYWQGGGDPALAWDTKGNAYFAGLHFNRGSPPIGVSDNPDYSSGVFVYRSTGNGGASWNFPGTAVATCYMPTTNENTGLPLEDKPYLAIDDTSGGTHSHTDRIYVTWTYFDTNFDAYLYEAYSLDYGRTFSAPVLITNTSDSSSLCPNNYGLTTPNGPCNQNQFTNPFVGADGSLYVAWSNYNTTQATSSSGDNRTQILLAKSTDGGASFGPAVQVGYYYDLPDCGTYQGQDEFRACVPEQGTQAESVFRASNLPSGSADPTNASHIVVTYGSYINKDSNASTPGNGETGCAPNGTDSDVFTELYNGVKTAACANKILVSVSTDGGATFTGTGTDPRTMTIVPQDPSQAHADQWFQWAAFNKDGKLAVSYYDRAYGSDITSGDMDFTLSVAAPNSTNFKQKRVTTSSMPVPTDFPDAAGNSLFFGDYTGLAVADQAHPLWSDTRETDLVECPASGPPAICTFLADGAGGDDPANNEDIFTDRVGL